MPLPHSRLPPLPLTLSAANADPAAHPAVRSKCTDFHRAAGERVGRAAVWCGEVGAREAVLRRAPTTPVMQ
jgi:hypothetical protein